MYQKTDHDKALVACSKESSGNHYIGYYSTSEPEHVFLVASSFKIFMNKFLKQLESTLTVNNEAIYIDNNDWFLNPEKLVIQYLQSQGTSEYKEYNFFNMKIK